VAVSGNEKLAKVLIFNASGKMVREFTDIQGFYDLSNLPGGNYFLEIHTSKRREIKKNRKTCVLISEFFLPSCYEIKKM
jgi:hypothetical protein